MEQEPFYLLKHSEMDDGIFLLLRMEQESFYLLKHSEVDGARVVSFRAALRGG
ncbi:MAG: hypothetical protein F6K40_19710 [Okeania sp. SIO3I5]|uniref:hypothetical protein n=1 Tax=Okeania sp. SIO3I5 TaxID=2607805 RepID=UPI0013BC1E7D|nr:hypothetical protein [Okeania sp. SIO3I5]NEQ38370.1 hypothetical protein [Okeania sp. SIO3I5]